MSRTNSRVVPSKLPDPKRLSSEFSVHTTVPLLTPSSAVQSIPPSPLKPEFTSTPPQVVKPLPVLYAARELQFDHDQSEDRTMKRLVKINQSRVEDLKQSNKPDQSDGKIEEKDKTDPKLNQIQTSGSKTPSRSSSVTFLEDSIKLSSKDTEKMTADGSANGENLEAAKTTEDLEKIRAMSDASSSFQVDTVSIDNISQVIDSLESHDGKFSVQCWKLEKFLLFLILKLPWELYCPISGTVNSK